MKPKVEVYFVIYLATIISFFAVETEVRRYKKNQDNLLLQASQAQINKIIQISENSSWDGDYSNFKLDVFIDGDYLKDNFKAMASFKFPEDEKANEPVFKTYRTDTLKLVNRNQNKYSVELKTKEFGKYRNVEGEIELEVQYVPAFSEEKMNYWAEVFGGEKIAKKIKRILDKKVKEQGPFSVFKDIKKKFKPGGEGIVTKFNLAFDSKERAVLKGIPWRIPVTVGGVFSEKDFVLEVTSGKQLIDSIEIDHPRSYLYGRGLSVGNIEITGAREDGETAKDRIKLNLFQPQYEVESIVNEFYIDESFPFDARIKEVGSDKISVEVTSSLIKGNKLAFGSPNFEIGPFKKEGKVKIGVFVDGNKVSSLDRIYKVKRPGPPQITFEKRVGERLQFRIATYGTKNKLDGAPIVDEGLEDMTEYQKPSSPQYNVRYYYYEGLLKPPSETMGVVNVEFSVYDAYDAESIYENQFQYTIF